MRTISLVVAAAILAAPAAAQQNPFKIKGASQPVSVSYTIAGSTTGTGEYAASSDKFMRHSTTTGKMFGKTINTDEWSLMTSGNIYTADLAKKKGTKAPNMLPAMAKAYDNLSGTEKARMAQNMKDMAQMISQAFGATGMIGQSSGGTATYAGHTCVEHTMGSFSSCVLRDAPQVALHSSGSMFCMDFEQTATKVTMGSVPPGAFDLPAGITFTTDTALTTQSDSMARTLVRYMASQELADSLAVARKKQPASHASAGGTDSMPKLSKEDCEKLRNLDLGKMVSASFKSVVGDAVNEAVHEKEQEAKEKAKSKIKGLIKKPKIF